MRLPTRVMARSKSEFHVGCRFWPRGRVVGIECDTLRASLDRSAHGWPAPVVLDVEDLVIRVRRIVFAPLPECREDRPQAPSFRGQKVLVTCPAARFLVRSRPEDARCSQ